MEGADVMHIMNSKKSGKNEKNPNNLCAIAYRASGTVGGYPGVDGVFCYAEVVSDFIDREPAVVHVCIQTECGGRMAAIESV